MKFVASSCHKFNVISTDSAADKDQSTHVVTRSDGTSGDPADALNTAAQQLQGLGGIMSMVNGLLGSIGNGANLGGLTNGVAGNGVPANTKVNLYNSPSAQQVPRQKPPLTKSSWDRIPSKPFFPKNIFTSSVEAFMYKFT